jgi:hypothetical protein
MSHAEGNSSTATGYASHAEGDATQALGTSSHAEGSFTTANGQYSHAEGNTTTASGSGSHAEGNSTKATSNNSHAEGNNTTASGDNSHAEGSNTIANGVQSHVGGFGNTANSNNSFIHSEQSTVNIGASNSAILGGYNNIVNNDVINSIILGGTGIVATQDNTVYGINFSGDTVSATTFYGSGYGLTDINSNSVIGFVHLSGDTMTGNLFVPTLSANTLDISNQIINSNTGDVLINNNLKITGDLVVLGSTITANTEQLLIKDNTLTLNYGETGGTVTKGSAGLEIDRGTGDTYQILFIESAQTFNVGVNGNTQPVATREVSPINNGIAIWDSNNYRFDTTLNLSANTISATTYYGNGSQLTGLITANDYTTGTTFNNNIIYFNRTNGLSAYTVDLSSLDNSSSVSGNTSAINSHTGDTSIHFTKSSINLSDLGNSAHTHSISGITNLQYNLDKKVDLSGDTMTGDLIVPSLSAITNITINSLSGSTIRDIKVNVDGTLIVSDDKQYLTGITGTSVVDMIISSTGDASIWDYVVKSSSGIRAGTITSAWSGNTAEFYEISTNDIGDTRGVNLNVDVSGGIVRLITSVSGGTWSIKTNRTLL